MMPSGFTSTSSNGIGAINTSDAFSENGWADSPWKDRVQSTCFSFSSRIKGSSARPCVMSFMGDWSSMESAFAEARGEGVALVGAGVGEAVGGGLVAEVEASLRT